MGARAFSSGRVFFAQMVHLPANFKKGYVYGM